VIMLVFLAAMAVTREVETGVLKRLMISRMTATDLLGGVSLSIVLLGVVSVLVTFGTAWALGFRSQGPLWVAILVSAVTTLSIVGTGLIVACYTRTVTQAFVIANFPLGLFMFFSGSMFPMPKTALLHVAGRGIGPFDLLPPTHAVTALNQVLTLGAGVSEVVYELSALGVLSALYLGLGVWLFGRRRLRAE
jgi:ABC-2 type transport system permease protein